MVYLRKSFYAESGDWQSASASARYTADLIAQFSETHTFSVQTNGGLRVWFGGELMLDDWAGSTSRTLSFTRDLVAGQHYPVRVEYQRRSAAAPQLSFSWSGFSTPAAIVPQSQLVSGLAHLTFVSNPVASPAGGVHGDSATISLSVATPASGAQIHYTLDGSEPTQASALYLAPLTVTADTTLKARAYASGYSPSGITVETYTIDNSAPEVSLPTFTPTGSTAPIGLPATLTTNGTFGVTATDSSGIQRVEFRLNGTLFATDTTPSNGFTAPFVIEAVPDGPHELSIQAWDNAGQVSAPLNVAFTVALPSPPAPVFTAPANLTKTNRTTATLRGTSSKGALITLLGTSAVAPPTTLAAADGTFAFAVDLEPGDNTFQATATNRNPVPSAPSAPLVVTYDNTVPGTPLGLTARARSGARIQLDWQAPLSGLASGYFLFRSTAPIPADTVFTPADALGGAGNILRNFSHTDTTAVSGTRYHYRVVAAHTVSGGEQTLGLPSNSADALADGVAPSATVALASVSAPFDAATLRFGRGLVRATVTFSEPLSASPFFNLTTAGGPPLFVDLTPQGDRAYSGVFTIAENTFPGPLGAVVTAYDLASNRGTTVTLDAPYVVDNRGPRVLELVRGTLDEAAQFVALPFSPAIKNLPAPPATAHTLRWLATFDEPSAAPPAFTATLSGPPALAVPVTVSDAGDTDPLTWLITLELPAAAGLAADGEALTLAFTAADDFANPGDSILPPHVFQIYQGDLPPLAAPATLTATSRPAGAIELVWSLVSQSTAYVIQVKGPGDADFSDLETLTAVETTFTHTPAIDGSYAYRVGSVREQNGELAYGFTAPVIALSDRVPPPPPATLALAIYPQGVLATWTPPADTSGLVGFALYRAPAAPDTVAGLTPAVANIPASATQALDSAPAGTSPHYAVVALDAAGNASAPRLAFINVAHLPVSTLAIERSAPAAAPVLSWTPAAGSVIDGFNVFVNGAPVLSSGSPLWPASARNYADIDSSGGERAYLVQTVSGANTLPREIRLPDVAFSVAPDAVLKRGLMNTLPVTVRNLSATTPLDAARLTLRVADRDHAAPLFIDLAPGAETVASIVVGGYDELAASSAPLALRLVQNPASGETVTVRDTLSVPVANGALRAELIPGEFTRGGAGRVRFTLENTGSEPIEFKVARANGATASDHVRLRVSTASGVNLSITPLQLALSSPDVITLPDGTSVVRIAAGAAYTSPEITVPVPATAPASVAVGLEIDWIYYQYGRPGTEVRLAGPRATATASTLETSYRAELLSVAPVLSNGDVPVTLAGRALWRALDADSPAALAPSVPVVISIRQGTFIRRETVVTDATGAWSYAYQPAAQQKGGHYQVWASHPDAIAAPDSPATFTLRSLVVSPLGYNVRAPRHYRQTLPVGIATGPGTEVFNLRAELAPGSALPTGLSVATTSLAHVGENQGVTLPFSFVGSELSLAPHTFSYRIVSDGPDGLLLWDTITVNATITSAAPLVQAAPAAPALGVQPGTRATVDITLRNQGFAPLENAAFSLQPSPLTPVAPAWLGIQSAPALDLLDVGGTHVVTLLAAPPADPGMLVDQIYQVYVRVTDGSGVTTDIPLTVTLSVSGRGTATFKIEDPYTSFGAPANNPFYNGVVGASVVLERETSLGYAAPLGRTADSLGIARFEDIPAGRYKLRVTADKRDTHLGRITIQPGDNAAQTIQLTYNPVTFTWEVVPVTFQDRYEITLNATFETQVPLPVIIVEPGAINLPKMCPGQVYNGEFRITNHGLIDATNVRLPIPPDDEYFSYEILADFGDRIRAGQTVVVPYRVRSLKALPGECRELVLENDQGEGGGGSPPPSGGSTPCGTYATCFNITYFYDCANGLRYSSDRTFCFYRPYGYCPPSSGSPIPKTITLGTGAGQPTNYGFGGGGGGGGSSLKPGSGTPSDDCFPRRLGDACGGLDGGPMAPKDCDSQASPFRQACSQQVSLLAFTTSGGSLPPSLVDDISPTSRQINDSAEGLSIPVGNENLVIGLRMHGPHTTRSWEGRIRAVDTGAGFALVRNGTLFLGAGGSLGTLDSETGAPVVFQAPGAAPAETFREQNGPRTITKFADGRLVLHEGDGRSTLYDESGRMLELSNSRGMYARYNYASDGLLTHISDRNDAVVALFAYTDGLLTSVSDYTGRTVLYGYDSHGRINSITTPDGVVTTYTHDNHSQITSIRRHILGTPASEDQVTHYEYRTLVAAPTVQLPQSDIVIGSARAGDALNSYVTAITTLVDGVEFKRTFQYKYDTARRTYQVTALTSTGREESHEYDAQGVLLSKSINGRKVYSMQQDARVRVITIGKDRRITEEYDDRGRLVRRVNPDGGIEIWEHDPLLNKIKRHTDPLGVVTAYTYDELGNLLTSTEAVGTSLQRVSVSEYYPGTTLVKKRTEPDGIQTAYEYDAEERVLRAYDPRFPERQTVYTYDQMGRVATETDAVGYVTSFVYDASGRIVERIDALGQKTLYTYQGDNLVRKEEGQVAGASGRITRHVYDAAGRRIQERRVNAAGQESVFRSFAYDAEGKQLSETNALGQVVRYAYDADGNPTALRLPDADGGVSEAFTLYDELGQPVESVDPLGKRITTQYDLMGRPKVVTEAAGTSLARVTTYRYDLMGRRLETGLAPENNPAAASTETSVYDALGRLVATGGNAVSPVSYSYDAADRVLSRTDALGRVVDFLYDAHGQLEKERIDGVFTAHYAYDLVGNRITITDGEGNHRHFRYDALRRVTHESIALHPSQAPPAEWWTQPAYIRQATTYTPHGEVATLTRYTVFGGTVHAATTVRTYDAFGRLVTETDPAGLTITHDYDEADGLLRTTYPPVTSSGETQPTTETYLRSPHNAAVVDAVIDRAGNVIRFAYDKNFRVVEETNSMGGVTETEYDVLGRVAAVTRPGGEVARMAYDHRDLPLTLTHPDHQAGVRERIEQFVHDAFGRLVQKTGAGAYPMLYRYDAVGNLLEQQDDNGAITRWSYTARNQVATKTYADNTAHHYTYDAAGRVVTRTDALNRTTVYEHSPDGQPLLIDYPTDSNVSFSYDQQGRVLSMTDGSGETTWTYDALGRPATETQSRSGRTLRFAYDSHSRRTQLEVVAAGVQPWRTSYGYDNAGRLRTLLDNRRPSGQPYVYTYAPDANLIAKLTTPTGHQTTKSHDTQGRLVSTATHSSTLPVPGSPLAAFAYTYDAAGQRVTETTPDRTRSFAYDQHRQLIAATGAMGADDTEQFSFSYDNIGNRLEAGRVVSSATSGVTVYAPNAVNQYTAITGLLADAPSYDANGNTTTLGGKFLRYDEEDRLVEVFDLTRTVRYIYDGLGRRVERIEIPADGPLTATRYVYDGRRVIEELSWDTGTSTFILSSSYTRGLDLSGSLEGAGGIGGLLALSRPEGAGWVAADYVHDGGGNVTHLIGAAGTVLARYTYGPFGERLTATGEWAEVNSYQFSGKERDAFTGYYYYGYRFHDPATGRWLSRDPLQERGGVNLYGFNGNNAVNFVDGDGLIPLPVITGIIGGALGGTISGFQAYMGGARGWDLAMQAGKGALTGGVAGFAAGVYPGAGIAGFMASGFLADAAGQHAAMAFGWQPCYDLRQGLLSALIGGAAGKLAPHLSAVAGKALSGLKAASKYADDLVQKALRSGKKYADDIAPSASTSSANAAGRGGVLEAAERTASRRAYLNNKFGRTGDLHRDINYRGAVEQIQRNASDATAQAIAQGIPRTKGRLGSRAHDIYEDLNIATNERIRGTGFSVSAEEFRAPSRGPGLPGRIGGRRAKGTLGVDAILIENGIPIKGFDLKTGRGWSPSQLSERQRRFGVPVEQIYTGP